MTSITLNLSHAQIHSGCLILVNSDYGFVERTPAESDNQLIPACDAFSSILLQKRAARLLDSLMTQIQGWSQIVPVSGWRSFKEQQDIWNDSLEENGVEFTQKYVALPGHSEHQTGLAIDLGLKKDSIDFICPDFPYSGICQLFREQATDYGFIERYPKGSENLTGIGHEPWHFRYVGIPHAAIMQNHHLTLEEYMEFIRHFPHGQNPYLFHIGRREVTVSYLNYPDCLNEGIKLTVNADTPYYVSGNNVDGFIVTEWR